MGVGQSVEHINAMRGEPYVHLAPVFGTAFADNQILHSQTIDQTNGAMVCDLELFSKFSDGRRISSWKTFNSEERLVLARSNPGRCSLRLAEAQELPEIVSECSQGFILCLGYAGGSCFLAGVHSNEF